MLHPFSFFLSFRHCLFFLRYFPAMFSGLCSLFSFPVCSLGHILLSFFLFCFCFSGFSIVYGVYVLRLPYFPWGFSGAFRVPHLFFGISFLLLFVFPSLQFWYSLLLLLLLSSDILGFDSVLGVAILLRFWLWLRLSLPFCIHSAFSARCGSGCSLRSFSAFFRMLWLWLVFRSSFVFSACCGYGCPFLSSSAFQSDATPAAHSGLHSRFPYAVPLAAPSLLARLVLSSMLQILRWRFLGCPDAAFPCVSALFLSQGFHRMIRFSLVCFLRLHSLPWCLLLLVLVCGVLRSDFSSSSADLPCSVLFDIMVLWCFWRVQISGSRRNVVSLWDESGLLQPLFSRF